MPMTSVPMSGAGRRKSEPPEAEGPGSPGPWDHSREVSLRRANEVVPFLDGLTAALADLGYPVHDRAGVRLALGEAVLNGLWHGNGGDPARRVRVRCRLGPEALLAEVEDEGPGFDPGRVPDRTLPEHRGRPGGRGLLLMRRFMTWVRFSERGNRVTLCKYRSA
jgi:serine/threonine-protein kinase RsbW